MQAQTGPLSLSGFPQGDKERTELPVDAAFLESFVLSWIRDAVLMHLRHCSGLE